MGIDKEALNNNLEIQDSGNNKERKHTDTLIENVKKDLEERGEFDRPDINNVNDETAEEMKNAGTREFILRESINNFSIHIAERERQEEEYNDLLKKKEEIEKELSETKFRQLNKKSELEIRLKGVRAQIGIIGRNLKDTEPLIKSMKERLEILSGNKESKN